MWYEQGYIPLITIDIYDMNKEIRGVKSCGIRLASQPCRMSGARTRNHIVAGLDNCEAVIQLFPGQRHASGTSRTNTSQIHEWDWYPL